MLVQAGVPTPYAEDFGEISGVAVVEGDATTQLYWPEASESVSNGEPCLKVGRAALDLSSTMAAVS